MKKCPLLLGFENLEKTLAPLSQIFFLIFIHYFKSSKPAVISYKCKNVSTS